MITNRQIHHLGMCFGLWFALLLGLFGMISPARADETTHLNVAYKTDVQPLLKQFCYKCHSGDTAEAEIDLTAFVDLTQIRQHPKTWQQISEMLTSEQMPPQDAVQPSTEERARMHQWVQNYLTMEAAAHAGDPGPVVLRRLNNVEYTYTLQDLTQIGDLNVAKEFPVDSAAGEGFTNVGNSLVMSPSLLTKYLDAAKEVAAHAVLLPEGMRFSTYMTRRDWVNEYLTKIRGLYGRYTGHGGGLTGVQKEPGEDWRAYLQRLGANRSGKLSVERYLLATIEDREALASGTKTIEVVAKERGLSPKYLGTVWTMLNDGDAKSLLIDPLRVKWKTANSAEILQLMELITPWQNFLFKFNPVGQIGLHENIHSWLVPVNPLVSRHEFRVKLPGEEKGEISLSLQADDAGDGNANDDAVWERPRFVMAGRPDLLLRDVDRVATTVTQSRDRYAAQSAKCLAAAHEADQSSAPIELALLAKKHGVDVEALTAWLDYLGVGNGGRQALGTPMLGKQESFEASDFIKGWIGEDGHSVLANLSDQRVRVPGDMQPQSVFVHPSATRAVVIGWRSPIAATIKISGSIQHRDPACGDKTLWSLQRRRGNTRQQLAAGRSKGAELLSVGSFDSVVVRPGDVIALVISPKETQACDLTAIDLTLSDGKHEWNLWKEILPDILAGNPHADSQGNPDVWHFTSEPVSASVGTVFPVDSLISKWQAASEPTEKLRLADELQRVLQLDPATLSKDSPEAFLVQQFRSLSGPFLSPILNAAANAPSDLPTVTQPKWGLPLMRFGRSLDGRVTEDANLCVHAPEILEVRLPAEFVAGSEFVTSGLLHPEMAQEGSVRLQVQMTPAGAVGPSSTASAMLVTEGSQTAQRIQTAFEEFRSLFPPTLCYSQIVPADETVTLILFYREDDQLRRLMLTPEESAQLDQLWQELLYVSQEPLEISSAFVQLYQYATQDRPDLMPGFERLRKPVQDRVDAFRQKLIDNEPQQLNAVIEFAKKAYRRPLIDTDVAQIRDLYASLRVQELAHDEALRLTLARVLVSPAFLYRLEKPGAGTKAGPVSDDELANRLSYFLWSSAPDAELLSLAAAGKLHDPDVVAAQARRMLKDAKIRRMATEFGCHWLHIHDFDHLDEKSERHFPTFNALRGAMYEESILVLTDMLQNDRSVVSLVDGDSTFLNEELARHYGIPGIMGREWRRVENVRQYSRGSILSLATTLSKQSGASRTSPILRGNWLSEVVLGEKLPRPPKNVPVLSETVPEGLTERQLIARHTSDRACAKCHLRFDPFGFALEGFDAIGRLRTTDAAGLPIDTKTVLFDGTSVDGLADLKHYLGTTRRQAFVGQFQRKLLGYALGRSVQLSDEPLLAEIQKQLNQNDNHVAIVVEAIVRSPQFREIRGRNRVSDE